MTVRKAECMLGAMTLSQFPFLQKYLFFLVHIKGLLTGGFGKKYYGQWGEDIVLDKFFAEKNRGFFVDVGAYHPMHYSNTYLLYKNGWRGINIDANPNSIRLFNLHRRRDINLNYGVSENAATKTYFVFNHQSCNTFSAEQKEEMLRKSFIRLIEEKEILCVPLQKLLDEHAPHTPIDLLNIDVEGMGLEVLRSLDWNTRPRVICVEDDELDLSDPNSDTCSFLKARGYALHSKVGPTCIYCLVSDRT